MSSRGPLISCARAIKSAYGIMGQGIWGHNESELRWANYGHEKGRDVLVSRCRELCRLNPTGQGGRGRVL